MSIATVTDSSRKSSQLDFEQIYREHSPMIYRAAYAVTGNRQDADDVLQTVFLKLIKREYPPDLHANPKAYLHRAAVNLSLDLLRRRRRYPAAVDLDEVEVSASDGGPTEAEIDVRLNEVLAELQPEAVHILVLRYVHDYSDSEISKMLGTSRGAIALRLFRLRARIRRLLGRERGQRL
jgi:RNA polymerase sigma-70 factor, ECF subfamily